MKKNFGLIILLVISLALIFTSCGIANKKVESIQILSGAPTEIEVGQTPDFSALKAKITYNDGEVKEVGYADLTVSNPDTSKVGRVEYTVSYEGSSVTLTINVKAQSTINTTTLESITYLSGIQTEFFVGADFHTTDLKVTAHYSDGSTKTVTADKLSIVQNIDNDVAGEQTLIVEYEKKRCEIKITVVDIKPSSLALILNGFDSSVLVGQSFDTTPITATLHYNNSSTQTLTNADLTFTAPDSSSVGTKTLVASYQGFSAECTVEILGIKSIEFSGFSTSLKVGENIDLSKLKATVIATDNEDYEISADQITVDKSKFDTTLTTTNSKTTKITFTYCGASKEYNVTVTAEREDATLTELVYVSGVKTKIFVGEEFDDSAIIASAKYTYGYTSLLDITKAALTVSGSVDNTKAGTYPVTYSYTENGKTVSFTLNVEVKEPGPSDLVIHDEGFADWVIKGEAIDTSKITATLYYEFGTKKTELKNSELTFSGVDSSTPGKITITVSHAESGLSEKVTVHVIGIQSITFSGIKERYRVNTAIDKSAVIINIVGTDGKTYARTADANAIFPALTLDASKTSEKKEYVFSYLGSEYKQEIEVYAEFEDTTLISIEYSGATRVLVGDQFDNKISVKAIYTYGFFKEYKLADGVTYTGTVNTALAGKYDITVSYGEKSTAATVSVEFPKVTGITILSAPYGIKNETYDLKKLLVTLNLENNTSVTEYLSNLSDYGITVDIDVATAGEKSLTLTSNGVSAITSVVIYEISKIVINTDKFTNIIQLGTIFSTAGLGEIYIYLIGRDEPAIRNVTTFNDNVDVSVEGTYYLTTTYLGITSEAVKITVTQQNFVITGAEDSAAIEAWKNKTYASTFLDSGYCYFVGDDNPFKYDIKFHLFDLINKLPDTRELTYESSSYVTLNGIPVGEEYVVIDEINHTFDFTDAAIGKTFVITTSHKDYPEHSKKLEVTVVDGYNVDEAIELNLFTNANDSIGHSGKYQLEVLYPFLASNQVAGINNMSYEEYVAFVNSINGIIVHKNLTISTADLPEDYFFITQNGDKYIWDHQTIYNRFFTEINLENPETSGTAPETFNVYGNYFTIVSNNVPVVAGKDETKTPVNKDGIATNDDDGLSSSQLFRFDISPEIEAAAEAANKFYAENYVVNFYALGLRDNDPSVSIETELARKRHLLGVIGMKYRHGVYNINAVNAEAYFITSFPDNDDLIVNYDYCTFYNAWSNHIMTWALNYLDKTSDDKFDGAVHEGYKPITLNITNSFIGKCGGPVIIAVNKDPAAEYNYLAGSKTDVNIDNNTNIFSYVKGVESWFTAYKASPVMQQIIQMNYFFKANGASFETTVKGDSFVNMILLNMEAGFVPGSATGATNDLDGYISIAGDKKLDMDDVYVHYGHNGIVDAIHGMAAGAPQIPPVFVSEIGGATYFDGSSLQVVPLPGYGEAESKYAALNGKYVSLFYYNLGVLLGFNEEALSAEPKPENCTVTRITESHGIK